jgi:hypothetical protein
MCLLVAMVEDMTISSSGQSLGLPRVITVQSLPAISLLGLQPLQERRTIAMPNNSNLHRDHRCLKCLLRNNNNISRAVNLRMTKEAIFMMSTMTTTEMIPRQIGRARHLP